jgi:SagB-type dehydrogenase family enzyme
MQRNQFFEIGDDARVIDLWSLREDVLLETMTSGLVLLTRWGEARVDRPDPLVHETLRRMSFGPVNLDNVAPPEAGAAIRRRLTVLLDRLQYVVIRSIGLAENGRPLLSVVPITREARFAPEIVPPAARLRLSRMVTMRVQDDGLVVESPLGAHRVLVHHPLIGAVLTALAGPVTLDTVTAQTRLPYAVVTAVVSHLVGAGLAVLAHDPDGIVFAEDTEPALRFWSHHELLFHARSRAGRGDGAYGAVFPAGGPASPEPVVKRPPHGTQIKLFRPVLDDLLAHDPPITAVIEARRSYHRFGARPVTAEQIGELLYRAARLRAVRPGGPGRPAGSDRPYPSTGGLHELELYVIVDAGQGLPQAVHHYDPGEHVLTELNSAPGDVAALLDACRVAGGLDSRPPVLIAITARFRRLSGTHQGGLYASTLRHVGVLQQSLYLIATAMGLAPCAVMTRDDDERAVRALRLDWRVESGVGEFVIGNRPESVPDEPETVPANDPEWPFRSRAVIESCL